MATQTLVQPMPNRPTPRSQTVNVSAPERLASAVGAGALLTYSLTHESRNRALLMIAGGGLLYRAISGSCLLYQALGVNTAIPKGENGAASVHHGEGIKVEHSITVNRSPEELYRFWRNIENLPVFMEHLESVRVLSDGRSHWVVKAPAGKTVEWDAEIHNEIENELIAWRSMRNADINNAGSVRFRRLPSGETEVKVAVSYEPPFGRFGLEIAKLFGEDPDQQLRDDLLRFKHMMETGGPSDEIKWRSI